MILHHFTCAHSAPEIKESGHLQPWTQRQLDGRKLIWLTDLDAPTRAQLGLTSYLLRCDRMEYRVTVDCEARRWMPYVRAEFGSARSRRSALHVSQTPGALPMHWWVTDVPVPVVTVERAR